MPILIDIPNLKKEQEEILKDYLLQQAKLFLKFISKDEELINFGPNGLTKEEFEEYLVLTGNKANGKKVD